jgi:hypothetical protein
MSKLSDPSIRYVVRPRVVAKTFEFLRLKGNAGHEGVVLWLGKLEQAACTISEPLIPAQETGSLFYRISEDETFRILEIVATKGLTVPIQVHSHPQEAFHSWADDERAFVRHENAISIVMPDFARFPDEDFVLRSRFYRLAADSSWKEIPPKEVLGIFSFRSP